MRHCAEDRAVAWPAAFASQGARLDPPSTQTRERPFRVANRVVGERGHAAKLPPTESTGPLGPSASRVA